MNRAISERGCERLVDKPVLIDQRQPLEAVACHRHLEVVAAAGAVLDGQLRGVGECLLQQRA